ncbi:centromere protein X isoform X1 [Monodon monoceros]|uniref:Centromere protein X n=1 Tax=Delphinapterus leucas TaxID=9749 RepID=A0A2Y9PIA1_DELLE|nr:centromere protein X isoform X1 [Delphinapterus leucas]XP_029066593.1 centromere protein X isoform X1 [Monodon monoceros]
MTLVLHTFRPPWMGFRGRVAEGWVGSLVCGKRERVCRNRAGELVSKLLHLHFKDDKTKVSGDALQLMAELLKIFVVEAAIRSVRQAQAEDLAQVDVEQLEKVLPQLLLDF